MMMTDKRFELVEVSYGPWPLISRDRKRFIALVQVYDRCRAAVLDCIVEIRLVDGEIVRGFCPPAGDTRCTDLDNEPAVVRFLESLKPAQFDEPLAAARGAVEMGAAEVYEVEQPS